MAAEPAAALFLINVRRDSDLFMFPVVFVWPLKICVFFHFPEQARQCDKKMAMEEEMKITFW